MGSIIISVQSDKAHALHIKQNRFWKLVSFNQKFGRRLYQTTRQKPAEVSLLSFHFASSWETFASREGIAKLFCQKFVSSRSPGWIVIGKIFIPITEISVAKSEISVTEAARLLIWSNWIFFFRRKERRGEISEIEPAQSTGLTWRGPLLRTPERVRVQKPWRSVQSALAYNNLFANFSTLS